MKFKNVNKNKLIVILLSSFVITSFTACENNSYNNNIPTYETTKENQTQKNETTKENQTQKNETTKENIMEKESSTVNKQTNTQSQYSTNDITVINELEKLNEETDKLIKNDESIFDKAKGIFITTVDFIFYDSEIKGVKFDELTQKGKQKVLEISTNIDTKIENKFPNYKDKISEKASSALNKASELIKKGAKNIGEFAKDKLGDENYNNLIEAKDDLVKYSKKAISIIGDFSSDLYKSSKQKIKNWYEEFKNKNTSN